ncbi:hypothetical protein [uncultured Pseudokineococcus sp.]|uniref:hypothetical protein n=1 Tax=uncultured Pseudokineococcus sp. TaxID=1642928 RepID=UPI002604EFDF|nr:hypothetical protein [uncultured Pseudokineococcus sp.]
MTAGGRRRRPPLVADVVPWHVERTPVELVLGRSALAALGLAVALASTSSVDVEPPGAGPRVPEDPQEQLHLGDALTVHGSAPWLPRPALGPQSLRVDGRSASLTPLDGSSGRALPLADLVVTAATCHDRYRRRRRAGARWSLDVVGPGATATVTGPWLALAWLGHLADWPEPEAP